jgi:hypothetical protein
VLRRLSQQMPPSHDIYGPDPSVIGLGSDNQHRTRSRGGTGVASSQSGRPVVASGKSPMRPGGRPTPAKLAREGLLTKGTGRSARALTAAHDATGSYTTAEAGTPAVSADVTGSRISLSSAPALGEGRDRERVRVGAVEAYLAKAYAAEAAQREQATALRSYAKQQQTDVHRRQILAYAPGKPSAAAGGQHDRRGDKNARNKQRAATGTANAGVTDRVPVQLDPEDKALKDAADAFHSEVHEAFLRQQWGHDQSAPPTLPQVGATHTTVPTDTVTHPEAADTEVAQSDS